MKNLKKYLITILVIAVVAVVMTTCILLNKKEETAELKTIRVNEVTRSVFYAPQYVAINNGYFEEEGLKIPYTSICTNDTKRWFLLSKQRKNR